MLSFLYLLATTTTTTTPSCSDLTTVNMDPANDWDSTYVSPSQCPPPSGTDSCKCVQDSTQFFLTNPGCTEFPIGGSGQVDDGFTMLTLTDNIQVGIRAQERFKGVVGVNPTPGTGSSAGVGLYTVEPGLSVPATSSSGAVGSWWGIDWQVDLRPGSKTIADYLGDGGLRLTASCIDEGPSGSGCGTFLSTFQLLLHLSLVIPGIFFNHPRIPILVSGLGLLHQPQTLLVMVAMIRMLKQRMSSVFS